MEYLDFDLEIARAGKKYSARVLRSPAGEGSCLFKLPFSELQLENLVLKLARTGTRTRGIDSPDAAAAKEFGGRLFTAVFNAELQSRLGTSLSIAGERRSGLRIRLRLKANELIDLPWEFLYRRDLQQFLALGAETPLVRYLDIPNPIPALSVKLPLRVLVVVASPAGFPSLDTERELQNLETALGELIKKGLLLLEKRPHISLTKLQAALRTQEWHVLHFVGHGMFDTANADGILLFEDEAGNPDRVSAEYLGTLLHNRPSLRLAVLNACEGARTSRSDPFAGTAQNLLLHGLPAVIGMQFPISDSAAISFAREFYAALAEGLPVDTALVEARMAVYTDLRSMEWGTPVLYMRSPDGQLFDIKSNIEGLPPPAGAGSQPPGPEAPEPPIPPIGPVSPPRPPVPVTADWSMDRYRVLATVYRGKYSNVRKCVALETDSVCVVKDTDVSRVSLEALEALTRLKCPNLATPTRLWQDGARLYEELPYVGGVRLSDAIVPGFGRLGGRALARFHDQMMDALAELHGAGIVHRDIHPENVYLVAENVNSESWERFARDRGGSLFVSDPDALTGKEEGNVPGDEVSLWLRFVVVDHTFAVLAADATAAAPVVHDSYTPAEQALGSPTFASDIYSLGATIYHAITGQEVPDFVRRRLDPEALGELPDGDHPESKFQAHLANLVALDQSRRPRAARFRHPNRETLEPGYSGTLRISPTQLLITDSDYGPCILNKSDALVFFQSLVVDKWWLEHEAQKHKEVDYWIRELSPRQ